MFRGSVDKDRYHIFRPGYCVADLDSAAFGGASEDAQHQLAAFHDSWDQVAEQLKVSLDSQMALTILMGGCIICE